MGDFIVGGYIPGTNLQLSFQLWLAIFAVFIAFGRYVYKENKRWFEAEKAIVFGTHLTSNDKRYRTPPQGLKTARITAVLQVSTGVLLHLFWKQVRSTFQSKRPTGLTFRLR